MQFFFMLFEKIIILIVHRKLELVKDIFNLEER